MLRYDSNLVCTSDRCPLHSQVGPGTRAGWALAMGSHLKAVPGFSSLKDEAKMSPNFFYPLSIILYLMVLVLFMNL